MRHMVITLGLLGGLIGTTDTASAQYYYERGYYPPPPPRYYRERHYRYGYDPRPYVGRNPYSGRPTRDINEAAGCPRGWTVQSGVCKPYRGY